MALAKLGSMTALPQGVSSVTVSLTQGWDEIPENGPPSAGDLVVIEVVKPKTHVEGPAGWERAETGNVFMRRIGPHERDPVFRAAAPDGWEVRGVAFSDFRPWSDAGSAVPRPEPGSAGACEIGKAMEATWGDAR